MKMGEWYMLLLMCMSTRFPPGFRQVSAAARSPLRGQPGPRPAPAQFPPGFRQVPGRARGRGTQVPPPSVQLWHMHRAHAGHGTGRLSAKVLLIPQSPGPAWEIPPPYPTAKGRAVR